MFRVLSRYLVLLLCISPAIGRMARAGDFFFKDGDKVVLIGDSITEQHLYSNYVEMWVTSRLPSWNITFRNVGIGGDRSPGGNARFARDVLIHQPTAMTVAFGMNDAGYRAFDDSLYKTYMEGLSGISQQAAAANVRVAWLTPSPEEKAIDGPAKAGYNEVLEKFSAAVAEIAASSSSAFVDQFHPFVELQEKARAAAPANRIGGGDAIHPGPPGQAVMAWSILKGLHFPARVSAVGIDASTKQVNLAENCEVSELSAQEGQVSLMRKDAALPFFPAEAKSILAWVPILDELNDYRLQIAGLAEGTYVIKIDGVEIARHTAAELSQGVNLASAALAAGPIAEQVNRLWEAVQAKNRYYHDQVFRGVVLAPVNIPDFLGITISAEEIESKRAAAVTERMAKLPELDGAIRPHLVMQPHRFEISRAP